ncbi:glycosyltransferase family 4 protein [Chryseolinea lacunae]|uniref:Glycosyltransferase n=1 Tax=Chryseolinea lacunae TaxID=2801331 RepID=A0ABS1L328_9BACT|nr:glycosyltransferase [Chryseolinea lacunae]MBL0745843.1 glycosyltransferase [Chryseolinea lacunae]
MRDSKIILATAYAVNPYKGSEDGMGWNLICQIARFRPVIAVTRQNNRRHIEQFMQEHPNPLYANMVFEYFDLPYWMRFWKKGGRGAMLYFWMWQRALPGFIRQRKLVFDIAHNLNFHNDWTPSYLWKLKKPFVWGPIGHHPQIPAAFLKPYKKRYRFYETLTWHVKNAFWKFSPALRNTISHAAHVLCMNRAVANVIDLSKKQVSIMPSVATEDHNNHRSQPRQKFTVLSAGRLVPLKGFDLTILSFARFLATLHPVEQERCELIIVGSGPEESYYRHLVQQQGVEAHVRFFAWMERSLLLQQYADAAAFLFPSHEGAGMVVAEALSFGVPVVCLDNSGPGEFIDASCGIAVPATSVNETINGLAAALGGLHGDERKRRALSHGARARFESHFQWNRRGDQLDHLYQNLSV